jgi:hypothetical protein
MSKLDRFRDSEQLSLGGLLADAAQSTGDGNGGDNNRKIKLNAPYMGFRVGTNPAEARQRFVQRHSLKVG